MSWLIDLILWIYSNFLLSVLDDHILRHWYKSNDYTLQAILLWSFAFVKFMRLINRIALFVCLCDVCVIHFGFTNFIMHICLSVHKFIRNLCPILSTVDERQKTKQAKISNFCFCVYLQLAPRCLNTCILTTRFICTWKRTHSNAALVCHTYRMNTN